MHFPNIYQLLTNNIVNNMYSFNKLGGKKAPKILNNMINLEANLAVENKAQFANKKRNIINSL